MSHLKKKKKGGGKVLREKTGPVGKVYGLPLW